MPIQQVQPRFANLADSFFKGYDSQTALNQQNRFANLKEDQINQQNKFTQQRSDLALKQDARADRTAQMQEIKFDNEQDQIEYRHIQRRFARVADDNGYRGAIADLIKEGKADPDDFPATLEEFQATPEGAAIFSVQSKGKPVAITDPATGKGKFVTPDQALGQEPFKKPLVVNNNTLNDRKVEFTEREGIAKVQVKQFEDVINKGIAADDALDNINQIEAIDVKTGFFEPAKVPLAAAINALGFDGSAIANAANAQSFKGISNRMVNDVLNRAKGPQTEGDAQRARSTLASLGNEDQANKFMSASLKALALRQKEQSEFYQLGIDGGKKVSEVVREWNAFKRKTPSLSAVIKTPDGLPVFYYQFKENAQRVRPGITDEEIIKAWREANAK